MSHKEPAPIYSMYVNGKKKVMAVTKILLRPLELEHYDNAAPRTRKVVRPCSTYSNPVMSFAVSYHQTLNILYGTHTSNLNYFPSEFCISSRGCQNLNISKEQSSEILVINKE